MPNASATTTATVRTGWNMTLFAAVASLIYKWTGWNLQVEDLLPLSPVIGIVGGIFYRLSRYIADSAPQVGWILFGTKKAPTAYVEPPKE